MSEFDELRRLRNADPVAAASVPSLDDDGPRALRERILMDTQTPTTKRWSRTVIAAAGATSIAAAAIAFAVTRGGDDAGGAPITPDPGMAMCVATYDLGTLAERDFAFDGTVERVNGDDVTFTVTEWFRGGADATVTLGGASSFGGLTSVGDASVPMEPGTRLLVAGDDTFAWSCGFTQLYDADVAASWRSTLS